MQNYISVYSERDFWSRIHFTGALWRWETWRSYTTTCWLLCYL